MVPADGRDVQCSNCSTTWFQPGPRIAEPVAEPTPDLTPTPEPRLAAVDVEGPSGEPDTDDGTRPERPARRQIDPDVADILREEAERESRLRQETQAPEPVEQQEEMPLVSAEDEARDDARARRIAELEGAEDAFESDDDIAAAVAGVTAASRREIFPDIEEINSTLRATGDRREEEANATDVDTLGSTDRKRGKVRLGFFLVLIIAAIGVGLYAYAPQIAGLVPALASPLDAYVDLVNQGRFWLDDMARSLADTSSSE
jgi:hypothetical protein